MRTIDEISKWEALQSAIESIDKPNIFLGNGFNMCLGVNTSYQSLYNGMDKQDPFNVLKESDPLFIKNVIKNNFNLESQLDMIDGKLGKSYIVTTLYQTILNRCRTRYKRKEVVSFLLKFGKFFTSNYDPLLYRFLLSSKNPKERPKDHFYRDIEEIHNGRVSDLGSFEDIPLIGVSKKQVYEISLKIFKEEGIHINRKRDEYFEVLKQIRNEEIINLNDGFVISQPAKEFSKSTFRYKSWDKKEGKGQNLYYLHGAMHIYTDKNKIKKIILKKGHHDDDFIKDITSSSVQASCVFEQTSEKKRKKINENPYLKYCLNSLERMNKELFIIGWSCSESDQHLIDSINESQIKKLYISYHSEDTKESFKDMFPSKDLVFFPAKILPFSKKTIRQGA